MTLDTTMAYHASERPRSRALVSVAHWVLLVVAVLSLLLSNLLFWVDRTVIDSNEFASVTSDVLDKPEVEARIADVMAQWIVDNSDLQDRLAARLPEDIAFAQPILLRQIQSLLAQISQAILANKTFGTVRDNLIERLHARMIAILRDDKRLLHAEGGSLVIDLREPLTRVFERLNVTPPERLQDPAATQLVVLQDTAGLKQTSQFVKHAGTLAWGSLLVAALAFAGVVLTAHDRRGGLKRVGLAILLVGFVTLLVLFIGNRILKSEAEDRVVLQELVRGFGSNLRLQSIFLFLLGLGIVAVTDGRVRGWIGAGAAQGGRIVDRVGAVPAALVTGSVLVVFLVAAT